MHARFPNIGWQGWRGILQKKLTIISLALAYLLTLGTVMAAPPSGVGAMVEGRLQQHLDHVAQTPAVAAESITIIREADSLSDNDISPHGGKLRYRYGRLHEVAIPGNKLAALLAHLPANVLARLPYPMDWWLLSARASPRPAQGTL
jgi:hypothetical protein